VTFCEQKPEQQLVQTQLFHVTENFEILEVFDVDLIWRYLLTMQGFF